MEDFILKLPFHLGTTSYIIPDEILPNARYLSAHVRDVELVLFELDEGPSNFPNAAIIHSLNDISSASGLSYTVHLPLDLRLGADGDEQHVSMLKAHKVIDVTQHLDPFAYVLHLDGREVKDSRDLQVLQRWQDQATRALEVAAGLAGGAEKLAVENLEGYPLDFWEPVLARIPVSRCVDIGHLWLDHHDPLPYLAQALPRTRVIHLHGINTRDHQSLSYIPAEKLDPVLGYLIGYPYQAVLTLEIFSEADLHSSLAAISASLARLGGLKGA